MSDAAWDAVVVGAGPAGSVTACLLARQGWRVLLVEKKAWPREKACGGCLNAAGVALLQQSGLGEAVANAPSLTRFDLRLAAHRLSLAMPAGAAVTRRAFDAALVAAAVSAGVTFSPDTHARLQALADPSHRTLTLTRHGVARDHAAALVIAADGLRGPLVEQEPWACWQGTPGSRIGISATAPGFDLSPHTIHMCVAPAGYVGLVRVPNSDATHLGAALDPLASRAAGGPLPLMRRILHSCGIDVVLPATTPFEGTRPLTGHRAAVGGQRVLLVGDACGYIEPFTGEGMAWALRGAVALTGLLGAAPGGWDEGLPNRWRAVHAREIGRRQSWCRAIRAIVHRPSLARACVAAARVFPMVPRHLARRICA